MKEIPMAREVCPHGNKHKDCPHVMCNIAWKTMQEVFGDGK